ncbi:Mandelate racemase/muconate lactonizing protein [Beutenbergia cavernae DSM 12333]|uniref:Mandelate racemase/muconate lactonizing protein n=1 Tax=Beutenbergia cavernae (strain ATCC BAA-8 / DSM 12333 / CCUG 43141 / JCM 11478 / NBRC 16432 / NCIMB 13614 / HKI 0122) TaxID=471853 RepID=C5C546_BEUC1|nr:mandelate racemase/muconate lactonizing enzyme family protein [Beutenbergia cavernae]ACQ82186.1 Mandelate racemase/muconate lactonizing protein [Beutenbergia cavernae DSM 12333]
MGVIRTVETFRLRIDKGAPPDAPRFVASPRVRSIYPTADETLLVRIATDDAVGWGEALAPASPEAPGALVDHVFAPALIGADLATGVRPLTRRLQQTGRERGHLSGIQADALAAIDTALWDLLGHELGLPAHLLLGGSERAHVPVYLTSVEGSDDAARAASARAARDAGHTRFKLHLTTSPEETLASYDAVSDAVGPGARIAVDAHWVHQLGDARRLARGLDERGAWFFEAPLAPEDLAGHVTLAAGAITPIAVGEAMRHRFEFAQWAQAQAVRIAQPDIGRTGITEGLAIAGVLEAQHVPIAPHHSMATGIAYAAGLHVCAAADDLLAMEWSPHVLRRSAGFMDVSPLELARGDDGGSPLGGSVPLPSGPGLGLTVDDDAVRALAAG